MVQTEDDLVQRVLYGCSGIVPFSSRVFTRYLVPRNQNLGMGTGVFNFKLTKEIRMTFTQSISKFHHEESGQDLVEYALVLIAVAAGVLAGSTTLSSDFTVWMGKLNTKISNYLT